MIFITDELGKFEKNIIELAENVGFKECKTIEAIDLFCGISERNDVLKEKDRYYAFIDIPQYWSVRADGLNGAIYDNKTKKANIYFKNPIEKRMVSRVEWIDRNNTVYKVDYYNKYGYMYCSENVSGGNVTVREFYDRNGDIKVLEQTGPKTYTTFGTRISPKSYRGFADYLEAYPLKPDYAKEIDKRLDGIIALLNYGDIVIFQYPSWIGVNYDESFVNKIKSYRDTKLIIFVQDIQKLMFDSEQAILDMEIKTLNKADLLILPSKKMHRYLKENGLDEKPVIYQTIWDMPSDICFVDHAVTRCFHFAGNYNRFPFLAEYHGKTPIYQYDANKPDRENDDSFCWRGYFEQEKLMHELSKGGFGLVWSDDEYFDRYYSMNQPYKLGTNLAAGIPVIVKRGCVHEKFVERNGLGYAVDTLDEADKLVQSITDAEYIKLYHNVKNIQKLILDGAYTRKTLQDAIIEVLENACTPVENRYQDHI